MTTQAAPKAKENIDMQEMLEEVMAGMVAAISTAGVSGASAAEINALAVLGMTVYAIGVNALRVVDES